MTSSGGSSRAKMHHGPGDISALSRSTIDNCTDVSIGDKIATIGDGDAQNTLEDDSTEMPDVTWYTSSRTCTAVMSALGYTFFYLLRVNMSLAMVFMVADHSIPNSTPNSIPNSTPNSTPNSALGSTNLSNHRRWYPTTAPYFEVRTTDDAPNKTSHVSALHGSNPFPVEGANDSTSSPLMSALTTQALEVSMETSDEDECIDSEESEGRRHKVKGEFAWSKEMTGYILSSFFYGYIVTQFPGGWLATRFGAKHIFGGGMFISIVATFLTPLAARTHPYWLIILRVIMGLAHGAGFPATHVLYSLWFPPLERTRYITFAQAGTMAGAIVAFSVSGFICDIRFDNGWPFIFYIYGSASLLWYILWNCFVFNSPLEHPRIDPIERNYIISKIGPSVYSGVLRSNRVPWSNVVRSMPVWAIVVSHFGNNWANYTILVCIPLFMKEVLKFNTKENGVLTSLPYLLSFFVSIASGQLADLLIRKEILSTTSTRKLLQLLASGIPAALLVGIGYVNCQSRRWAVLLLCLIVGTNSFSKAGFIINHVDIAPRYAGLLLGISNTLGTAPGILSPIVVGLLTTEGTQEEWVAVFNTCAVLLVASCLFYLVFGDGRLQKWAAPSLAGMISTNGEAKQTHVEGAHESLVTRI